MHDVCHCPRFHARVYTNASSCPGPSLPPKVCIYRVELASFTALIVCLDIMNKMLYILHLPVSSAGYEAIDAAGVPEMLIHHLNHASASKIAADANHCDMDITTCILSMCSQPLLSLRLSQSPAALQRCAGR